MSTLDSVARSALFLPATRLDRLPKALQSGADVVIVDLEDAVAPQDKDTARQALSTVLADVPVGSGHRVMVRVNAAAPWWAQDLAQCAALAAIDAVMVPKAESAGQMQQAHELSGGKPLVALIETALGFEQRAAVAAHPAVRRLAFGSIDFQADLGISAEGDALLMFRSALVLSSRLAGLQPPLDGVTVDIQDPAVVREDAGRARGLGFGGKLCIHPTQVVPVNEAFSPTPQELAWARRVVQASAASAGAAVAVDGKMVDKPVLLRAQALLAQIR